MVKLSPQQRFRIELLTPDQILSIDADELPWQSSGPCHSNDFTLDNLGITKGREVLHSEMNGTEKENEQKYHHMVSIENVVPPPNFAMVSPGIYRSGYPQAFNHSFLKLLKLKTLIYLCPENCNEDNVKFCKENNISIMQFGIQGNKEPFTDIPEPVRILFTPFFYIVNMRSLSKAFVL